MTSTEKLKLRLEAMGLSPKRAFGQNFLVNPAVIDRIVGAVKARAHDDLLEVGPGLGALTEPMLALDLKPRLIEIDAEIAVYWRTRELEVNEGDALHLDWTRIALKPKTLLVSNLPYNISTSLVIDRCLGPETITQMVLMFQKEVAERLTALPRTKNYGTLSVLTQNHFALRRITDASPRDFFPAPKVMSRVLAFTRKPAPGLGEGFLKFVKAGFQFRRKFLLKNLRGVVDKSKHIELATALLELGFGEKARAEELSPEHFAALYRKLHEH